jgi:hypothetical protein
MWFIFDRRHLALLPMLPIGMTFFCSIKMLLNSYQPSPVGGELCLFKITVQ